MFSHKVKWNYKSSKYFQLDAMLFRWNFIQHILYFAVQGGKINNAKRQHFKISYSWFPISAFYFQFFSEFPFRTHLQ